MLLLTQHKCTSLTAISSHCLATLPATIPAFYSHMQQNQGCQVVINKKAT